MFEYCVLSSRYNSENFILIPPEVEQLLDIGKPIDSGDQICWFSEGKIYAYLNTIIIISY